MIVKSEKPNGALQGLRVATAQSPQSAVFNANISKLNEQFGIMVGMRSVFAVGLIAAIIFAGSYWYVSTAAVCPAPLHYRLGSYDDRFKLERDETKVLIGEAERGWEQATGRELFVYDETAAFTINFVYDERQRRAVSEEELRADLDAKERQNEETRETIERLQDQYGRLKVAYEKRVRLYERRLSSYNERVEELNAAGGASPQEVEELEREQKSLEREGKELDSMTDSLNELVASINELGTYGNELIEDYNKGVALYNDRYGEAGAFTQGEFLGDRINIYKYNDRPELLKVLTHELGHSLGIDHVEDPKAIMYYLLEQQPNELTLAAEDVTQFKLVCGDGKELTHRLRRMIRTVLSFIT